MEKLIIFLFSLITAHYSLFSQDIYPTHWWVGMKNPNLQLILHEEGIANKIPMYKLSAAGMKLADGVTLRKVHRAENPNYVFLDLVIDKNAKPGERTFSFGPPSSALKIKYELKARDKARGIGAALLLWFYFALIYDGLVLLTLFAFSEYPMEKFTLLLSSLNPIDLGRIFIMLKMDVSALMGYTGALYKDFFGSATGVLFTAGIMLLWAAVPLWLAVRSFKRKDL